MRDAFVVEAVRGPVGRRNGGLSSVHPVDLDAAVLGELIRRVAIDLSAVDDVIFGCIDAIGGQAGNIARTSWLAAGAVMAARLATRWSSSPFDLMSAPLPPKAKGLTVIIPIAGFQTRRGSAHA